MYVQYLLYICRQFNYITLMDKYRYLSSLAMFGGIILVVLVMVFIFGFFHWPGFTIYLLCADFLIVCFSIALLLYIFKFGFLKSLIAENVSDAKKLRNVVIVALCLVILIGVAVFLKVIGVSYVAPVLMAMLLIEACIALYAGSLTAGLLRRKAGPTRKIIIHRPQ